jgi:two-component system chemotaxis response regulator CheY
MKQILAVDDSSSIRQMVSFTLSNAGYQVLEAVDGRDGMTKAGQQKFDLIITDLNMPSASCPATDLHPS